ncbi:MAG: hypothetical protein WDN27_01075 [Candidatus Saccharibacteria bacterium]
MRADAAIAEQDTPGVTNVISLDAARQKREAGVPTLDIAAIRQHIQNIQNGPEQPLQQPTISYEEAA